MLNPTTASVIVAVGRNAPEGIQLLGTAFGVATNKFATAAHVVDQSDNNLVVVLPKLMTMLDYQDTTDTQIKAATATIAAIDPLRDIAILQIEGAALTMQYLLSGADMAIPGTPVVTMGYPHAPHGRLVVTEQTTTVGARVLLGTPMIRSKHLILNIQTRPGQSGSPVFSANGGNVVGMVLGSYAPGQGGGVMLGDVDPSTLHQTTHAISAEYIGQML